MNPDEIMERVRAVLSRLFAYPAASVTRETTALDIDGWDSVSHVFVMMELESRFGIRIPTERVLDMDNVGDLVDTLADLVPKR